MPIECSVKLIIIDYLFCFRGYRAHRDLHSFPTRRSSDLRGDDARGGPRGRGRCRGRAHRELGRGRDRKSTRLNSSHVAISYAVFCLKKKTTSIPALTDTTYLAPALNIDRAITPTFTASVD